MLDDGWTLPKAQERTLQNAGMTIVCYSLTNEYVIQAHQQYVMIDSLPRSGPWSLRRIEAFCRDATIPLRLACIAPTGYPIVMSLWYLYEDGHLWCAVQADSKLAQHCQRIPRCGYEIAGDSPPYQGVRGTADVEIIGQAGAETLERLIERYLKSDQSELAQWLLSRSETEVALRITPKRFFTWDYSKRMKDIPPPAAS